MPLDASGGRTNGPVDRLEAVIFDVDGVVTRTASVHAAAWKAMFDSFLRAACGFGRRALRTVHR